MKTFETKMMHDLGYKGFNSRKRKVCAKGEGQRNQVMSKLVLERIEAEQREETKKVMQE